MLRSTLGIVLFFVPALCIGCAASGQKERMPAVAYLPPLNDRPAELASALIFDRRPGYYDAADFADRSSWPSVDSYVSPGQVIYFHERFVDYQDMPHDGHYNGYRRAETVRIGVGYR